MEPNSRSETSYNIPVTSEEEEAASENSDLVAVTVANSETSCHRNMWMQPQNESESNLVHDSASEVIDRLPSVVEVHTSVIQLPNEDRAANEVPASAVEVPQYVLTQSMTDIQGHGLAQVSTQMESTSSLSLSSDTVTVTAADLLSSVSSLQHGVESLSANIYSVAPSAESHALTSDTSVHMNQPTSVESGDVENHSHVVGNIVTHYHLGLGLGLDHQLLSAHDQPSDLLISSPVTVPVSDFSNVTTNNSNVQVSVSDSSDVAEHDGSFMYNEQQQLVDHGDEMENIAHLGTADGSDLPLLSSHVKIEVDGNSSSIDLNLEQQKEFDCLVETVSCYKCKVCSCILLSKEGVEQHVRMFHSSTSIKPQEKSEENSSLVANSTSDLHSDSNRRNETDLYICSPCKKGFPDMDSFTVHMAYIHHLSAGNIQLEPLVLANESGVQLPSMHHHGQLLFAPSATMQPVVMQQQQSQLYGQPQVFIQPQLHDKDEAVQIEKPTVQKGPPKTKRKLKTENENGDSKRPNILRKTKGQGKELLENVGKSNDDESDVILLDGEGSKSGELNDGDSNPNKKRVRSKAVKQFPVKRKNLKDKTVSDDPAVVGNRCDFNGCSVRLHSLENLEYHRKCHSEENNGFACAECKEKYDHWKTLSAHLWRIHLIDMELYTCDLCDYKSYSYGKLMNIHRRIHSDERPYLCDVCGKGFKTSKQLRNHKVIHLDYGKHRSYRSGECDICHRYFSDKRMLRVHKDTVHNKLRPYLCNYCGYAASCRSTLKMHIRQHTGEKPFACDSCDYRTADHNSLRRHKMRHSGEKPYKCPFCVYACIQSSTYKTHLKNKHPGMDEGLMFCCDQCSFRTIKKENYVTHMADHTNTVDKVAGNKEVPAAATADNQVSHTDMQTVHLPLQVVLTTQAQENQESAVHLISQTHEVHVTDASVLQQQIDGVMTQAQFVFPVLEDMRPDLNSQVFDVDAENHEEKFPILAGQLKMGHLVSNQETDSSETTETHLIGSHLEILHSEQEEVQDGEVGSEDHIPEEALSHAQLTPVPPAEVILHDD